MKPRHAVMSALLVTGQLTFPTGARADQQRQDERASYPSVFDRASATNAVAQSSPMAPHS
jgi:hypothetical protein